MTESNRTSDDASHGAGNRTTGRSTVADTAKRFISRFVFGRASSDDTVTRRDDGQTESEPGRTGAENNPLDGDERPPREQTLADSVPETDVPITFHTRYPTLSSTVPPVLVGPQTTMRYRRRPDRAKRSEPVTSDEDVRVPDGHYVLPAWCDVFVEIDDAGEIDVRTAGDTFHAETIPASNFGDLGRSIQHSDYCDDVVVLPCPWKVETPEHVAATVEHAPGHHTEPFRVVTTTTNTSYVHDLPVVLAFENRSERREILVSKGDPLLSVRPFVRSRPSATVEVSDEDFWDEYENSYPQVSLNFDDFETYVEKDPLLDTATHRDLLTNGLDDEE